MRTFSRVSLAAHNPPRIASRGSESGASERENRTEEIEGIGHQRDLDLRRARKSERQTETDRGKEQSPLTT